MEIRNNACGIIALYMLPGITVFAEDCVPVVLVELAEAPYRGGVVVGRGVLERRRVGDGIRARWLHVDGGRSVAMLEVSRRVGRSYFCHNPIDEAESGSQWGGRDQFSPFCVAYRRQHPGYRVRPAKRWLEQCTPMQMGEVWPLSEVESCVSRGAVVSRDRRSRSTSVSRRAQELASDISM